MGSAKTDHGRKKNREHQAKWFAQNKEKQRAKVKAKNKEYKKIRQDFIDSFKNVPCMDCGNTYPPVCMDFDHIRGTKIDNVSSLGSKRKPLELIREEIEKCEIVCANCHRLRTQSRQNYGPQV